MPPVTSSHGPPIRSLGRRLVFTFLPLLVLLGLGGLVEGGLRLAGYEGTTLADLQATQGFHKNFYVWRRDRLLGRWMLRERDATGMDVVRTNPALRVRGLADQQFPIAEPGTIRLFALGGSTVQGYLTMGSYGFPKRLQELLGETRPETSWRVVNLGVGGLDSMSLPEQVREITGIGADGIFVYVGDNEIGGALVRDCTDAYRVGLERWLNRVLLVRWVRSGWRAWRGTADLLTAEGVMSRQMDCMDEAVERMFAEERRRPAVGVTPPSVREDRLHAVTLRDLERNLEVSVDLAAGAHIPLWIVLPPINYLEAPRRPMPHPSLDAARTGEVTRTWGQALVAWETGDRVVAGDLAKRLQDLDPTHAGGAWLLGRLLLDEGRFTEARLLLGRGVDWDYRSARTTHPLLEVERRVCARNPGHVRCVDMKAAWEAVSEGGIPRDDLFLDFCHPTVPRGTSLMAEVLAGAVAEAVGPPPGASGVAP